MVQVIDNYKYIVCPKCKNKKHKIIECLVCSGDGFLRLFISLYCKSELAN